MCAQRDLASRLQPLLQELLTCLRRDRETLLQSGIDSAGIVDKALTRFLADGRNDELSDLQDWGRVEAAFDQLVACALDDNGTPREIEVPREGEPRRENGRDHGTPHSSELLNETTPQQMAGWLERLHAIVQEAHPAAIEIVELRAKSLANRDIADQLGLGLQLVKRIVGDLRAGTARAVGEG